MILDGTWSITVKLKKTSTEPPELFAHTLYAVVVHNWVAVPYTVPLLLPKEIPLGRLVLFNSQDVIIPEPLIAGVSGRSVETVSFTRVTFSGL